MSSVIKSAALADVMSLGAAGAFADWAPSGSIKIQTGFDAGGTTNTRGRAIAAAMGKNTGRDVVAENKLGGGGLALFSSLVRADADSETIGMSVTIPALVNLALRGDKLPF